MPVLSSLCPRTTPPKRLYHSDLADRSVKFWTVPTIARRAVLGRDAKNGTDAKIPSVPIFAYSVQRFLSARSRIGALRDDGAVRGYSRDDSPARHPDNAPGQDHGPSRKMGHNVQRLSREHTPHRKRSPPLKRGFKIKRIKSGYSLTVNSPSRKMGHAKSEKRREEEREEREERRLLVRVANVSTMFFLDWSYRRTGLRSWTAN